MFRRMCPWIPGVLCAAAVRFRWNGVLRRMDGILRRMLGLALVAALAPPFAYAEQTVTIDATHNGDAYGNSFPADDGTNFDGDPKGNTLNIVAGADVRGYAYGAWTDGGGIAAADNTVNMRGGKVTAWNTTSGELFGGYSESGLVTGNTVVISGGEVLKFVVGNVSYGGHVYGGASSSGDVAFNRVHLSGGTIEGHVFGGRSESGDAVNNTITMGDGTAEGWGLFGGWSHSGNAANNGIQIDGGTIHSRVVGGLSIDGDTTGNTVTMRAGTVGDGVIGTIIGGYSHYDGNAVNNTVVISGGTAGVSIYGGFTDSGDAVGNRVILSGTMTGRNAHGGNSFAGDARGNTVTMSGGTLSGRMDGGMTTHGAAVGNSVTVSGGTVDYYVVGGSGRGASNNSVTISGGTVAVLGYDPEPAGVYGGWSLHDAPDKGYDAVNNSVTVSGGTVGGNVYGGFLTYNHESTQGDAAGNRVTISGGTVAGDVYGGYLFTLNDLYASTGKATGNTVTISGTPNLTASNLYGGGTGDAFDVADVFTGNTLNVHTGGHRVNSVQNFEWMNFYVPATMGDGGVMLTAADSAEIDRVVVNVGVEGSRSPLKEGDHIVLIDVAASGGLRGTTDNDATDGRGMHGVTLRYDFDIFIPASNTDQLWARLKSIIVNPQTQVFPDGFLAGGVLLNQTGDRIAGKGLNCAVHTACRERKCGWGTFGDISGGWSNYHSGTTVNLNSLSAVVGVSRCSRRWTGGLFVEYGNGSYDGRHSFADFAPVQSRGSLDHVVGGVLGRREFGYGDNSGQGCFYLDGSVRIGNLHNKYTSDLRDRFGTAAGFTSSSTYCGTHVGIGRIRHFASGSAFDLSSKYFWTQMQGESLELTTGDPVDFESVNSHRFRLGGRYSFVPSHRVTPYLGGAWEREFSATARASTNGFAIPASSLRGDIGIGEVGITLKPASNRGFCIDLGVQCYAGKRDGVAAALYVGRKY